VLTGRALFQAVGVGELLHHLLVAPHGEPEHDLLPDRFPQQRGALEHFVTAQRNFLLGPTAQPRPPDGNALTVNDAVAVFDPPTVNVPLRVGLRTLAGQLLDFSLHHAFDEDLSHASQQIAEAGLGQFQHLRHRKRQLDWHWACQSELSEFFRRAAAADLVCFLQSDSPS